MPRKKKVRVCVLQRYSDGIGAWGLDSLFEDRDACVKVMARMGVFPDSENSAFLTHMEGSHAGKYVMTSMKVNSKNVVPSTRE